MTRLGVACVLAIALPRTVLAEEPAAPPPPPPPPPIVEPAPELSPDFRDNPVPVQAPRERTIEVEVPGERSTNNKLLVGGLLAAGVIGSALGVYWHLDSRDAANAVAADEFTGEAWTQDHIDLVERADRSKTRATIAYSIGGALLIGAVATYIFTEPKSETSIIRTGVIVTPEGGTMVSRMWSF